MAALRIDRSTPPPRRGGSWVRRFVWLAGLLGLGAAAYVGVAATGILGDQTLWLGDWLAVPDALKSRPEVRLVRASVERGRSADATVVATGYLESRRQAKIGARAPGRIEVVNVEEGSRVKKDDILAVLEHADLDASLAATAASLSRAQAAHAEQRILIAQNKREFERMRTLRQSNGISQSEYDQANFQYESAVARLESLAADIQLAEARLREAEQLKENMFIRAPFDGTVISKDAEVGESILPGGMGEASGRGSAVTIADLEHLEVDCDVKEDYISRVTADQGAEVAVDAVPGKRYHGVVRKIIPMGDRARATIKVKVAITDVDERLFPEMSATVYFLPAQTADAVVTEEPRMFCAAEAVVEDAQGKLVWIVDKAAHAQPKRVTVGSTKDGRVEILSGLEGDERIIAKPSELRAGQAVKVIE
ncbi:MAG: efflux RND transporter periplasmic adaptor subunit [Aureliella sp.]